MDPSVKKDEIYYTILNIIQNYFIEYCTGKNRNFHVEDENTYIIVKNMCDIILRDNIVEFRKDIDRCSDIENEIPEIVYDTIHDKITWGRVISIIAFGAYVTKVFKEKGRDNVVDLMPDIITESLLSRCRSWLSDQNCWDGLKAYVYNNKKFYYVTRYFRVAAFIITSLAVINLFL
ncbi:CNPV058 bcl-2 like protein [Canarypox virus]|uniref:Apoptosis regulator Bcl-2 homolog n=1 Tax=Canarypox virus TaxID=44088 RepID=ARBH_CNPV|nr:CNPV058 bcl-2 like protein [Canarypox virus]Q6VZT9.1 RecName: Full=Apoptosis regulator Bcl-2 homolog; Short=vBcl-2 [Canarypox virus]AAR83404.1 CNPV058 bcl-2 like protein [Canarypox virus]AWD84534.1 bcl-2 like protein [Canarypox virus]